MSTKRQEGCVSTARRLLPCRKEGACAMVDGEEDVSTPARQVEATSEERRPEVDLVGLDNDLHRAVEAISMMAANLRAYLLSRD